MKSIDLSKEHPRLSEVIQFAEREPVLLLAPNGHEFIIAEADDFDAEVEALRSSPRFQEFLDERMQNKVRIPVEQIEQQVDAELRET